MTQPTGVFVRLPLSEEQRELMVDAAAFGRPDDSHDKAILAIGTPVMGGELEVVEYSEYEPEYHSEGMGCGLEDRGIHDRYEAMGYGWDQALDRACSEFPEAVLLSDALAKLAEKDAEIGRDSERLDWLDKQPKSVMSDGKRSRILFYSPELGPWDDIREAIDAAREVG